MNGYRHHTLSIDRQRRSLSAHVFVLECFVGPRPEGMECRHLDGDKLNNAIDNLEWGTPMENYKDRLRHGTQVNTKGERHGLAKLTDGQVRAIRQDDRVQRVIAEEYGVAPITISRIKRRTHWKHI